MPITDETGMCFPAQTTPTGHIKPYLIVKIILSTFQCSTKLDFSNATFLIVRNQTGYLRIGYHYEVRLKPILLFKE